MMETSCRMSAKRGIVADLRARVVVAILLAGVTLASPLHRLAVLGRTPRGGSAPKGVDARAAKRMRSTTVVAPRLTRAEAALDGGRPRPVAHGRPLRPAAPVPGPPGARPSPTATSGPGTPFPLRC
jgi:hypothetical protein